MKLPKTRIKIVEYGSGEKLYFPMYKSWGFWHHMKLMGYSGTYNDWYRDIIDAKRAVDVFLRSKQNELVVSRTFIKYP